MEEEGFKPRNTNASERQKGEENWTLQKTNKETMYQF